MKKTDNSHTDIKVELRLNALPDKEIINVLECYSGNGILWSIVKQKTDKTIIVTKIEKEKNKGSFDTMHGDNIKFLKNIDLQSYDIIDLDAYGIPIKQLDVIFQLEYSGIIIVTAIQSGMGQLPHLLLESLGYTKEMITKCPTLFSENGLEKLKNYLYINGVRKITGYFIDRKNYFMFEIPKKAD